MCLSARLCPDTSGGVNLCMCVLGEASELRLFMIMGRMLILITITAATVFGCMKCFLCTWANLTFSVDIKAF